MQGTAKNRPRELGLRFGFLPTGQHNAITDVSGVGVGHVDVVSDGSLGTVRTGVTVVTPHQGNLFLDKVEAAVHVVNGFGKSVGLPQIEELGVIETPIALTNTLSVAAALDGLLDEVLAQNAEIGITTGTVNCVVGECNDGMLNDIRGRHVKPYHVGEALANTSLGSVTEGDVGAGKGMVCFGFKGGIGTSSRVIPEELGGYTLGCLVLSNFGRKEHLLVSGVPVGAELVRRESNTIEPRDGSIMILLATDAPLDSRQLGRLARRGGFGLARCGSVASHGSGDFVVAFSTTNRTRHFEENPTVTREIAVESGNLMTALFQAVVESVEEAVINSLFMAATVTGRDGKTIHALPVAEVLDIIER